MQDFKRQTSFRQGASELQGTAGIRSQQQARPRSANLIQQRTDQFLTQQRLFYQRHPCPATAAKALAQLNKLKLWNASQQRQHRLAFLRFLATGAVQGHPLIEWLQLQRFRPRLATEPVAGILHLITMSSLQMTATTAGQADNGTGIGKGL